MPTFRRTQAEAIVQVNWSPPAFALANSAAALSGHVHKHLAPLGLRTNDMRYDRRNDSVGGTFFECHLLAYTLTVRIGLESLEVHSLDTSRTDTGRATEIALSLSEHLLEIVPNLLAKTVSITTAMHGAIDSDISSVVGRYAKNAPTTLGALLGSGAMFMFGPEGSRLGLTVMLEPSALAATDLFIKVTTLLDPKDGPKPTAVRARTELSNALSALDLALVE